MERIIAPHSVDVAGADAPPASGTPGYATDGNPATNTPATLWPAYQYNALQEEIMSLIVAAGLTPDRNDNGQLLAAMLALMQKGGVVYALDTSVTANTIIAALSPAPTTLVDGMAIRVLIKNTNTGAATLNLNGLGATPIVDVSGALVANRLVANKTYSFIYQSAASSWLLSGPIQIASTAEAQGLSNDAAALTPKKLADAFGGKGKVYAANDSITLPSGLIINFGRSSTDGSGAAVTTFPKAFPNAAISLTATILTVGGLYPYIATFSSCPRNPLIFNIPIE